LEEVRQVRIALFVLTAKGVVKNHIYGHTELDLVRVRFNIDEVAEYA
jgi:hypothetical protein